MHLVPKPDSYPQTKKEIDRLVMNYLHSRALEEDRKREETAAKWPELWTLGLASLSFFYVLGVLWYLLKSIGGWL